MATRIQQTQAAAVQDPRTIEAAQRLAGGQAQGNVFEGGLINDSIYLSGFGSSDPRTRMIQQFEAGNDLFGRVAGMGAFLPDLARMSLAYSTGSYLTGGFISGGILGGILDTAVGAPMRLMGMGQYGAFQQERDFAQSASAAVIRHGASSQSLTGRGVSKDDAEAIAAVMKDFSNADDKSMDEIQSEMSDFLNRGIISNATGKEDFLRQYKEVKKGLADTIEVMGKTYEDAMTFMQGMTQGAGFSGGQVSGFMTELGRASKMTGLSTDHLMSMSLSGVEQFQGTGISGYTVGANRLGNLNNSITASQLGYVNGDTMWQLGGEQGAANAVMQGQMGFLNQGFGDALSRAAFVNGQFDQDRFRELSTRDPAEVMLLAANNMTPENQMAYLAQQQKIQNTLLQNPNLINGAMFNQLNLAGSTMGYDFSSPEGMDQMRGFMMQITGINDPNAIDAYLGSLAASGFRDVRGEQTDRLVRNKELSEGPLAFMFGRMGFAVDSVTDELGRFASNNAYAVNKGIDQWRQDMTDSWQKNINGVVFTSLTDIGIDELINFNATPQMDVARRGVNLEKQLFGKGNGELVQQAMREGVIDVASLERLDLVGSGLSMDDAFRQGYDTIDGSFTMYKGLDETYRQTHVALEDANFVWGSNSVESKSQYTFGGSDVSRQSVHQRVRSGLGSIRKGNKKSYNAGVLAGIESLGITLPEFNKLDSNTRHGLLNEIKLVMESSGGMVFSADELGTASLKMDIAGGDYESANREELTTLRNMMRENLNTTDEKYGQEDLDFLSSPEIVGLVQDWAASADNPEEQSKIYDELIKKGGTKVLTAYRDVLEYDKLTGPTSLLNEDGSLNVGGASGQYIPNRDLTTMMGSLQNITGTEAARAADFIGNELYARFDGQFNFGEKGGDLFNRLTGSRKGGVSYEDFNARYSVANNPMLAGALMSQRDLLDRVDSDSFGDVASSVYQVMKTSSDEFAAKFENQSDFMQALKESKNEDSQSAWNAFRSGAFGLAVDRLENGQKVQGQTGTTVRSQKDEAMLNYIQTSTATLQAIYRALPDKYKK